ncbi:MAG: hypothetical protein D6772_10935 [Bacteroidetes bacterium]|nr:MAG: hypothetical protein D6772_10935 [Bacteroidota bacterium]
MLAPSFRSTFLLYVALLLGQIIFCFIVLFLLTQPDQGPLTADSSYPYLGLIAVVAAGGIAWFLNHLRLSSLPKLQANFGGKIMHYRNSVILRSAVLESANLFCLVLALLEGSTTPILHFCLGVAVFLYFRPSVEEMAANYQLSIAEQESLRQELRWRR